MTDSEYRPPPERYLGDGVYAKFDGYHIWLWADRDGMKHFIALEPDVLNSLNRMAREVWRS